MIYSIAFNIIGFGWLISVAYLNFRLAGIAIHIDRIYPLKKKWWNKCISGKEIRRIAKESENEQLKTLVRKYRQTSTMIWLVLFGCPLLMILIGALNAWQNGTGN